MENKIGTDEPEVIVPTYEDIKFLAKQLRKYDLGWAKKLAKKMNTGYDAVWGISQNNHKNNELKIQFIKYGLILKDEYEENNKTVLADLAAFRNSAKTA